MTLCFQLIILLRGKGQTVRVHWLCSNYCLLAKVVDLSTNISSRVLISQMNSQELHSCKHFSILCSTTWIICSSCRSSLALFQADLRGTETSPPPSSFQKPHARFQTGLEQVQSQHNMHFQPPMPRPPLFAAWWGNVTPSHKDSWWLSLSEWCHKTSLLICFHCL